MGQAVGRLVDTAHIHEPRGWRCEQSLKVHATNLFRSQFLRRCEPGDGTMRDEVLRGEKFVSVLEARVVLADWLEEYNEHRHHRGLGMLTPRQFADRWKAGTE